MNDTTKPEHGPHNIGRKVVMTIREWDEKYNCYTADGGCIFHAASFDEGIEFTDEEPDKPAELGFHGATPIHGPRNIGRSFKFTTDAESYKVDEWDGRGYGGAGSESGKRGYALAYQLDEGRVEWVDEKPDAPAAAPQPTRTRCPNACNNGLTGFMSAMRCTACDGSGYVGA